MAARDGFECCFEIGVGLYIVEFAGFDERGNAAPIAAPFVMACKERVFAVQRNGSDRALDGVAIHLDGAIVRYNRKLV